MTRILLDKTVLEASLDRIRWLYDEFPVVIVTSSGGKDSTIALNLAIQVAREKGRLPVDVAFFDQEAEWEGTIEYQRRTAKRPEVRMHWFQVPFKTSNSSSSRKEWLHCWGPGEKWMREREPDSIHEADLGTDRFHKAFAGIAKHIAGDQPCATLTGMRSEESPMRMIATTTQDRYKGVTWAKKDNAKLGHYAFHVIYDWGYRDVWKAIHDHGWDYCKIYDKMYQLGVPTRAMRISGLTHEVALTSLRLLQEAEPHTWDALTHRLPGIHTCGNFGKDFFPSKLPEMFAAWGEYRDHLLHHLVAPHRWPAFSREFRRIEKMYGKMVGFDEAANRSLCQCIAANDFEFVKLANWERSPPVAGYRRWTQGKRGEAWMVNNRHIPTNDK